MLIFFGLILWALCWFSFMKEMVEIDLFPGPLRL